jgi:hypothetical protein
MKGLYEKYYMKHVIEKILNNTLCHYKKDFTPDYIKIYPKDDVKKMYILITLNTNNVSSYFDNKLINTFKINEKDIMFELNELTNFYDIISIFSQIQGKLDKKPLMAIKHNTLGF